MSDPYSPLKVFHHRVALDTLKAGGQPYPTHVQIILSDLCNQSCGFCAYRWEGYTSNAMFGVTREDGTRNNNPNRMIPTDKVMEILRDCRDMGVRALQFTGGGEPTVHPDHMLILDTAITMGFDVGLVTNGVVQKFGIVDTTSRLAWVRYSVDAGTSATYASLRKTDKANFAKVWQHIETVCSQSPKPLVGVGFVVTKENWNEVYRAAVMAKDHGADNFRISAVFQPDDEVYFGAFYQQAAELCRKAVLTLDDGVFRVFNMFGDRVADLKQNHPDYTTCGYQHFTTYIGGDQNVYRCCNTAYNPLGLVGSIKDQSFKTLWESKDKRDNYAAFDAQGCPRCQFNHKNKTIAYAMSKDPIHASFV